MNNLSSKRSVRTADQTKKEKGKPLIIKCRGTIPIGMMDLVGFILPTNETMPLYDHMFEGEDLVREIHPQIKIVRWRYKGKWPVKARDFVCGSWIWILKPFIILLLLLKILLAQCTRNMLGGLM